MSVTGFRGLLENVTPIVRTEQNDGAITSTLIKGAVKTRGKDGDSGRDFCASAVPTENIEEWQRWSHVQKKQHNQGVTISGTSVAFNSSNFHGSLSISNVIEFEKTQSKKGACMQGADRLRRSAGIICPSAWGTSVCLGLFLISTDSCEKRLSLHSAGCFTSLSLTLSLSFCCCLSQRL